jgi:hypothetical protein
MEMILKLAQFFVSSLGNQKTAAITNFFRTVNTESNRQKVKY